MISSPLRYPGGKARLYPYFAELLKQNKLIGTHYCEPYAGGAGLAIRLLTNGFVQQISINDIDSSIYAFWVSVLFDTERFCALVDRTAVTIDEWYKQNEIWEDGNLANPLTLGFAAYFLNRTNRSGIIEGAGPIGGFAQAGSWKLGVRLIKEKQIDNIRSLAKFRSKIKVSNLDALKFFERQVKDKDTLIYLDPPYFVKGQKLYKNFYEEKDHQEIAHALARKRNFKWVVSYDDVSQIRRVYKNFRPQKYSLNYSAGEKGIGSEIIFVSDALISPKSSFLRLAA